MKAKVRLYNSLSHTMEDFTPENPDMVTFYSCGPTVYNFAHIGNMRAYIFADTVKRVLRFAGYNVRHVMNYTDVEDKIIRDMKAKNLTLSELTEPFIQAFQHDIAKVGIMPADIYTKATDYITDMLAIIEILLEKGYAYKGEDGSIYFDVAKDEAYGKLVTIDKSALRENAKGRMKSDEYEKDSAQDFALWKAWDEADGSAVWNPEAILGHATDIPRGRPGWHIECSAMIRASLGESIDIHTGGVDNKFPHHENEIAQSECSSGKPLAKYFMHNEHVLVDGKKMSKSLGNFYTLRDLEERGYNLMSYRYWLLTTHYRTQVNFSLETLDASQTAYKRLVALTKECAAGEPGVAIEKELEKFTTSLVEDFSTPQAIAQVWDMLGNSEYTTGDKYATLLEIDKALGLGLSDISPDTIPDDMVRLAEERVQAKNNKDFARADQLRIQIESQGYGIKDTGAGFQLYKK